MAIRLSGMSSGLDTESIVAELVKAKSQKKEKLEKDQKRFGWKQDAWKELNSKIYNLYSSTLSDMRYVSSYSKKVTKSSSEAVSVITDSQSPNCIQTLKVNSMAKAGYLTGGKLEDTATSATKLTDMGIQAGSKITVTSNGTPTEIEITEDTTIGSFVTSLRNAGLNANFDENNQRFYISAKKTGVDEDFSITAAVDANGTVSAGGTTALSTLKINENDTTSGLVRIKGADASITLNGVEYTSNTNTMEINGLTITVNAMTDEEITLSTTDDTEGIYDMIKNFFKEYNELVNEMDKLYNADSADKYTMLSDEEKEAMSEDEVEEWEEKIKSALLRKDSTLGNVSSAMKSIMLAGVEMKDGSRMYLSDFGINTLGYLTAKENEKNAFHIDGDKDAIDSTVKMNTNTLQAMIASDPEKVTEFFSSLTKNLYEKLDDLMARTEYSSAFTVYNDKSMKEEYDNYKKKIAEQEELIAEYEDRYYDKFTAMEVALSKMESQQNAISGLFGM